MAHRLNMPPELFNQRPSMPKIPSWSIDKGASLQPPFQISRSQPTTLSDIEKIHPITEHDNSTANITCHSDPTVGFEPNSDDVHIVLSQLRESQSASPYHFHPPIAQQQSPTRTVRMAIVDGRATIIVREEEIRDAKPDFARPIKNISNNLRIPYLSGQETFDVPSSTASSETDDPTLVDTLDNESQDTGYPMHVTRAKETFSSPWRRNIQEMWSHSPSDTGEAKEKLSMTTKLDSGSTSPWPSLNFAVKRPMKRHGRIWESDSESDSDAMIVKVHEYPDPSSGNISKQRHIDMGPFLSSDSSPTPCAESRALSEATFFDGKTDTEHHSEDSEHSADDGCTPFFRKRLTQVLNKSRMARLIRDPLVATGRPTAQLNPNHFGTDITEPVARLRLLVLAPDSARTAAFKSIKGIRPCGPQCCRTFKTLHDMIYHLDEAHSREYRPYLCPIASCIWSIVGFHNLSECRRHIKGKHTDTRYMCPKPGCVKYFTRRDSCVRHTRTCDR